MKTDPEMRVPCYHVAVPARLYAPDKQIGKRDLPWTCLYVEKEAEAVLEEKGEGLVPVCGPTLGDDLGLTKYARSPANRDCAAGTRAPFR